MFEALNQVANTSCTAWQFANRNCYGFLVSAVPPILVEVDGFFDGDELGLFEVLAEPLIVFLVGLGFGTVLPLLPLLITSNSQVSS